MRSALFVIGICVMSASAGEGDLPTRIARAKKELDPRPLTYSATQATAADFLAQLEKQTGNVVADRRLNKSQQPLKLDFDKVPFWQALDRFCLLAGCGYTAYGNDGDVALLDTPRRSAHVSYHGIARTAVKRIAMVNDLETGAGTCRIHLDVAWEPRFQPFYLGVGPVTARYGGASQEVRAPARGQMPVAGRSASEVELLLPAPPRQAPVLASLEGTLKLLGPSKMLTFRFDKVKAGAALTQEEVSVRVSAVKEGLDRWLIEVQIDNPEGTPALETYQSWLDNNRVALVKADGARWLPEPNETVNSPDERRAVIEYAFSVTPGKGKLADWALVCSTPGRIVELVVPYRFSDVP